MRVWIIVFLLAAGLFWTGCGEDIVVADPGPEELYWAGPMNVKTESSEASVTISNRIGLRFVPGDGFLFYRLNNTTGNLFQTADGSGKYEYDGVTITFYDVTPGVPPDLVGTFNATFKDRHLLLGRQAEDERGLVTIIIELDMVDSFVEEES